ncbi:MAG TPA: hypothetical protein VMZ00_01925 [Sporichthya sp.]|nr:hypothetical protein [Sporichthya sp.]
MADAYARQAVADTTTHPAARAQVVRDALLTGAGRIGLRKGGHSETDRALAAMMPASRAAFVLLNLENLPPAQVTDLLTQAGVPDAATAVGLAERTPLDPTALRALVVPAATRFGPRTVAVAAGVLVLAVAAPVIAVSTSGGHDTPAPVSNQTPVQPAQQPAESTADAIAKAVQLDRDLSRILVRLDEELARPDQNKAEIQRLRTLRAAVIAQQKRLGGSPQ